MNAAAHAKINLGLVVGPLRSDGLHEVATLMQRLLLCDTVSVERASELSVEGFADDTLVSGALGGLSARADGAGFRATIDKQIPVAAGLGGGSSDAATALLLGNALLPAPLGMVELEALARSLGSDVPFFLAPGPKLASGDGTTLEPVSLPQDYTVVLLLPTGAQKLSTASVYARFDRAEGFEQRAERLRELAAQGRQLDLALLPGNDLVESPLAATLRALGAFRAEVSGAGPTLYGLFREPAQAAEAATRLAPHGRVWLTGPAW